MASSALAPTLRTPQVPAELLTACRDLAARYRGTFSPETVLRAVHETCQLFAAVMTPSPDTVAHVIRFAADWLADAAAGCGREHGGTGLPRVLFVCSHGAGRAQLAATALRRRADERGIAVHAVQAQRHPRAPMDDLVRSADVVITLGCGDICPVYLGRRYLDWPIPMWRTAAPQTTDIAAPRWVRDLIVEHVDGLLADLAAGRGRAESGESTASSRSRLN
ncbi:MAG: hypothetical protein ACRDVE_13150 [Actinocrinis sp.]